MENKMMEEMEEERPTAARAAAAAAAAVTAAMGFGSPPVWRLKSGERVVDRPNSHLHGEVAKLLPVALAAIESRGRLFLVESHDFGRVIGETVCVATHAGDQIVYAQREGRRGLTRFVKNRAAEPTAYVTCILKAGDAGDEFFLVTAFIGVPAEPEPWDKNLRDPAAKRKSREFWNSHALVWGSEPIVPDTEQTRCPW